MVGKEDSQKIFSKIQVPNEALSFQFSLQWPYCYKICTQKSRPKRSCDDYFALRLLPISYFVKLTPVGFILEMLYVVDDSSALKNCIFMFVNVTIAKTIVKNIGRCAQKMKFLPQLIEGYREWEGNRVLSCKNHSGGFTNTNVRTPLCLKPHIKI